MQVERIRPSIPKFLRDQWASSCVSLSRTAPAWYGVTEPQETCTSLMKPRHKSSWQVTLNHTAQVCSSSSTNWQRQRPMDTATGLKKTKVGRWRDAGGTKPTGRRTNFSNRSTALLLFLTLFLSKLTLKNICLRSSKIKHKCETFVKAFSQHCRDSSPKPSPTRYLLDLQCAA